MDKGEVFVRRLLYVFNHSSSFTPVCIADLDGFEAKIVENDYKGMTATLVHSWPLTSPSSNNASMLCRVFQFYLIH